MLLNRIDVQRHDVNDASVTEIWFRDDVNSVDLSLQCMFRLVRVGVVCMPTASTQQLRRFMIRMMLYEPGLVLFIYSFLIDRIQQPPMIHQNSFSHCIRLRRVCIPPKRIQIIGQNAFGSCSMLDSVDLGRVGVIECEAFYNCISLREIFFPSTVTLIGAKAFSGTGLHYVYFPSTVQTLEEGVCSECSDLELAIIEASVDKLPKDMFLSCHRLKQVMIMIPKLTLVQDKCFRSCWQLTTIDLSTTSLEIIGRDAFLECTSLMNIRFPSTLTTIQSFAFFGCENLSNVVFPPRLTFIGPHAFAFCKALGAVDLPVLVRHISDLAFYDSGVTKVTIRSCFVDIDTQSFGHCSKLTEVKGGHHYQAIVSYSAFEACVNLERFSLTLTKIRRSAFLGCHRLKSIDASFCVSIGADAFSGCTMLSDVILFDWPKFIGINAFKGCVHLRIRQKTPTQKMNKSLSRVWESRV